MWQSAAGLPTIGPRWPWNGSAFTCKKTAGETSPAVPTLPSASLRGNARRPEKSGLGRCGHHLVLNVLNRIVILLRIRPPTALAFFGAARRAYPEARTGKLTAVSLSHSRSLIQTEFAPLPVLVSRGVVTVGVSPVSSSFRGRFSDSG